MRKRTAAVVTACCLCAAAGAQQALNVPMAPGLVSVKLIFGLQDKEPTVWDGSYSVTAGRVIATDGWRFMGDDHAGLTAFKLEVRPFYELFWSRNKGKPLPMEPNGLILTLDGVTPATELKVETPYGSFSVPVSRLEYGKPQMYLGEPAKRQVEAERVPTSRTIVAAPTEDAYPSAARGSDGRVQVAYVAFTHGEGFRTRPPIKEVPDSFASLASPTGGDRVMATELRRGEWSSPQPLSPAGTDVFRTAVAVDGQDRPWVFWAAFVGGNWDLYASVRQGDAWRGPIRLTTTPGPDFNHVATTDAGGTVWLAWQSFDSSQADVLVAAIDGDALGPVERLSPSAANDWTPAIATSADGQVAVVWDSYETGDYNVLARVRRQGSWGRTHTIAGSSRNEARPSAVYDRQNRLWIAYEDSPEGWGKDFGPYDRSPKRMPLYRDRRIAARVLAGDSLYAPPGDAGLGMPMPHGGRRWPKSPASCLATNPVVGADDSGRVWLAARIRMQRFVSAAGSSWVSFLTSCEPDGWRSGVLVPGTDGLLHQSPALVPASEGGLMVLSSSDGRMRSSAFFGPKPWQRRQRPKDAPPPSTRATPSYPDIWVNWEIAAAETGPMPAPGPLELAPLAEAPPGEPSAEAQSEAADVAAMRAYRTQLGGKTLRILRGEFHRHTEISSDGGGDGTLFDMWRYALDMAALDWIGNGDHDNGGGREFTWWLTQKTTDLFHVPGAFTPMFTYERSCNYPDGHRNAVFAKRGVRALARLQKGMGKALDDLPPDAERPPTPDTLMFYQYLRELDGICASHTSGTDMGTDWRDNDPKVEPIVEIYQGDRQNYERPGAPRTNTAEYSLGGWRPLGFVSRALLKGYRLGFQSSSDHISTHMSYCNVFVEEATREAILDAMKRRRVYGATDNIIADVRCGGHFMGEEFAVTRPPTLRVKLIGTAPFRQVSIIKDNECVYSASPGTRVVELDWTDQQARPGKTSYYYVRGDQVGQTENRRVRSPSGTPVDIEIDNGEIVWVSPMWITYRPPPPR